MDHAEDVSSALRRAGHFVVVQHKEDLQQQPARSGEERSEVRSLLRKAKQQGRKRGVIGIIKTHACSLTMWSAQRVAASNFSCEIHRANGRCVQSAVMADARP